MIIIHKSDIRDFEGLFTKIDFYRDSLIEKTNFFISNDDNFYNISEHLKNCDSKLKAVFSKIKEIDFVTGCELIKRFNNGSLVHSKRTLQSSINSYYNWGCRLRYITRLI